MSEQSFHATPESKTVLDPDDRRSLERYICRRHTEVRVLAKPGCAAFPATVRDISQLGMPSLAWREVFACLGAVFIGGTAWTRLAVLGEPRPLDSGGVVRGAPPQAALSAATRDG